MSGSDYGREAANGLNTFLETLLAPVIEPLLWMIGFVVLVGVVIALGAWLGSRGRSV